jgi:outer membrane lipoprotein SlyB
MAINAGEPFVNDAAQSKVLRIPLANAAGTVTIDTANMHPSLANKVEIVASAIAGTLLPEQTYTGANGTTAFGIGLLDGLAVGPVAGWALVGATSGSMVAGTVGTVAGISGQATPGITTSKNVAVLVTLPATAAAGTGKIEVFLEIR